MKRLLPLLVATILLSTSCTKKEVNRIEGSAFGTMYHISYTGAVSPTLKREVDSVLESVNKTFSIFDTTSLLSRINRGETSLLNEDLRSILLLSMEVAEMTDNAFDCTIQPLIELWGFGRQNQKQIVAQSAIDSVKEYTGISRIQCNGDTLLKQDSRVQLNFNAIAKGFAVDKVAQYLKNQNYNNFIVEIGGEIVAQGNKSNGSKRGKPWKVGIQVPTQTADGAVESNETFKLENQAVATSGDYRNYFEQDGVRYTHILDPKTGRPEQTNLLSVTVIAPNCALADALATALMVMGLEKATDFSKKHNIETYFIYDDGGRYKVEHIQNDNKQTIK